MKVLLVYPNVSLKERYPNIIAGLFGGRQLPLGIFYLAAYLRREGFDAEAVDAEAQNLSAAEVADKAAGYDAVGISITSMAFKHGLEVATEIRHRHPWCVIIVGGPHVSSQPEHALQFPEFDYAVRGEGEETLLELMCLLRWRKFLQGGKSLAEIPGLIYRDGERIVVNPPRPYIENLDVLPFPAYGQVPNLAHYRPALFNWSRLPVAAIHTSRGCPGQCTFCDCSVFGSRFRARSAANIADEIQLLIEQYGVREIAFMDDTFTVQKPRLYDLFRILDERGLHFPWTCMARVSTVDEPLLRAMKAAGCNYIAFGIESGDDAVLKLIRKGTKTADIERVIRLCDEIGIATKGFFMIGHPGETPATIEKTIAFACRLPLRQAVVTINTPWPNTWQYEHAGQFGMLKATELEQKNHWHPVFIPYGLSREALLAAHRRFLWRFHLRPIWFWRILRAPGLWRQGWVLAQGLGNALLNRLRAAQCFLAARLDSHRAPHVGQFVGSPGRPPFRPPDGLTRMDEV